MKLNDDYVTYEASAEELIAVATGESVKQFSGLLRANEIAGVIMGYLREDITEGEIVSRLQDKYDADEDTIRSDVSEIIELLRSVGAIEE